MTLLAALTAGSGVHWLSSTIVVIFMPRTPPLAFHSSIASSAPSRVETPNVGTGPERGASTATFSSLGACWQPMTAIISTNTMAVSDRKRFILTSLIKLFCERSFIRNVAKLYTPPINCQYVPFSHAGHFPLSGQQISPHFRQIAVPDLERGQKHRRNGHNHVHAVEILNAFVIFRCVRQQHHEPADDIDSLREGDQVPRPQ